MLMCGLSSCVHGRGYVWAVTGSVDARLKRSIDTDEVLRWVANGNRNDIWGRRGGNVS